MYHICSVCCVCVCGTQYILRICGEFPQTNGKTLFTSLQTIATNCGGQIVRSATLFGDIENY